MGSEELNQRVADLRAGSAVRRCHVVRHSGEYTVGKHSHDMLSLLYVLWAQEGVHCAGGPEPPARLVRAVHFHDVHEEFTGDLPVTAKWFSHELGEEMGRLEAAARHGLGLGDLIRNLTAEELDWLDGLDKLELWLWCCDQVRGGNDHVRPVMDRLEGWLDDSGDDVPEPIRAFWEGYEHFPPSSIDDLVELGRAEKLLAGWQRLYADGSR